MYVHNNPSPSQLLPIAQLNNSAPGIGNQNTNVTAPTLINYTYKHLHIYIVYIALNVPLQLIKVATPGCLEHIQIDPGNLGSSSLFDL